MDVKLEKWHKCQVDKEVLKELSKKSDLKGLQHVSVFFGLLLVTAFSAMRMIVTVGWAIYPLGYVFGYLTGGVDADSLNVVYNLADFINKIAFGLVIWAAATSSSGRRAK